MIESRSRMLMVLVVLSIPVWLVMVFPAMFFVHDQRLDFYTRAFGYAVMGYPVVAVPGVIYAAIRYRRGAARAASVAMLVPVVYMSTLVAVVVVPTAIELVQGFQRAK